VASFFPSRPLPGRPLTICYEVRPPSLLAAIPPVLIATFFHRDVYFFQCCCRTCLSPFPQRRGDALLRSSSLPTNFSLFLLLARLHRAAPICLFHLCSSFCRLNNQQWTSFIDFTSGTLLFRASAQFAVIFPLQAECQRHPPVVLDLPLFS